MQPEIKDRLEWMKAENIATQKEVDDAILTIQVRNAEFAMLKANHRILRESYDRETLEFRERVKRCVFCIEYCLKWCSKDMPENLQELCREELLKSQKALAS